MLQSCNGNPYDHVKNKRWDRFTFIDVEKCVLSWNKNRWLEKEPIIGKAS